MIDECGDFDPENKSWDEVVGEAIKSIDAQRL